MSVGILYREKLLAVLSMDSNPMGVTDDRDGVPAGASDFVGLPVDLARVQAAFALPSALEVITHYRGSTGAWRIRSHNGDEFSLKTLPVNAPSFQLAGLRTAGLLERRAAAAGVDIVEPLEPAATALGLCARVDEYLVWMHRWTCLDPRAASDTPKQLHRWLGRTLATLHTLVPASSGLESELVHAYGLHPHADWRVWLEQAYRAGLPWSPAAADALLAIDEATRLARAALANESLPRCITHRDVNPPNVLRTTSRTLLCDFGYAGIDVPWYEAVSSALAFGPPAPAVLDAYLEAGGQPGPRTTVALARTTGFAMNWLAFNMWLALGHRRVASRRRTEATELVPKLLHKLVNDVEHLDDTRRDLFSV